MRKQWHPELATVGMCVLSQLISASSCERNWFVHRYIQTKIHKKRSLKLLRNLFRADSNSKMEAAVLNADELKMFALDNEDV